MYLLTIRQQLLIGKNNMSVFVISRQMVEARTNGRIMQVERRSNCGRNAGVTTA